MGLMLGDFPESGITEWVPLEEIGVETLLNVRMELHWAVQLPAAVAAMLLEPLPDHSHASLEWIGAGRLATRLIESKRNFRVALQLATLQLSLVDESGSAVTVLDLEGATMDDAYVWLEEHLGEFCQTRCTIERTQPEIPHHAVKDGAPFSRSDPAAFAELQNWYRDSHLILQELTRQVAGASAVRCWPHHFDIAVLITVGNQVPEPASIGVGMTPGDDFCAEPYWYVTPWPYPEDPELPRLARGMWHTSDWTGAVLVGSEVAMAAAPPDQVEAVWTFLDSAIAGSRKLLS